MCEAVMRNVPSLPRSRLKWRAGAHSTCILYGAWWNHARL
ncbi:hypothetical protein ATPR_1495 [Acetobacter tropicalis NBRC 101654]|uniref:Uncharacterized protein n=1 Tax=Acetobacter tropicalis NBRC 101654 TaxID=749388 RepID=F7VDP6_9PROT|nr:hypothetical protein ATPR_1495 [Acetobacter tropicalis NBRC 101654]